MKSLWRRNSHRLWVGQGSQPVVILLSGCVPQTQIDRPAVHLGGWGGARAGAGAAVYHNICRVIVEDGGDVLPGEGIGGVGYEQTCFT